MDIFPNKSLRFKTDYIDRYIKAAVDSVLESDIFGIFRRPFYTASVFTLKADVDWIVTQHSGFCWVCQPNLRLLNLLRVRQGCPKSVLLQINTLPKSL